ncbi:hypothetical protein QBC35DRAFT_510500 [Podospora australis]|uniref:Uncharacterized protein n=1 Tax=Podospora australis TaxID=1536484 RepID=A0AAN6WHH6_9PEZI|nr:hypothetical protein QBC35DRAFT_510500 [Podospora australis]
MVLHPLVTLFRQQEEALYRAVNLILQLSVLICIVFLTTSNTIHASEVLIAFWLQIGALSSLTGDKILFLGTTAGTARILLYAALSSYATWFWFVGLETVLPAPDGCEVVGWFGRAGMYGALRAFSKVVSIAGLAVCVGMMGWSVKLWLEKREVKYVKVGEEKHVAVVGVNRAQTDISLLSLSVTVIALSIGSIEYIIRVTTCQAMPVL